MSLKTMTVSKLKALKHQVEAAIHAKVTERRHEIESEANLSSIATADHIEPLPIKPPPVTSIDADVVPADLRTFRTITESSSAGGASD